MNKAEFGIRISELGEQFSDIANQSRPTAKIALLESYYDSDFMKRVLLYTYNPFFVYGVNEKTFNNKTSNIESNVEDIFSLLDVLRISKGTTEQTKENIRSFVYSFEDTSVQNLLKRIILKDLKIGINIETINKVFPKLIPTFKVALCETLEEQKDLRYSSYIVQPKLDGVRCIAIVKEDGSTELYTRNGSKLSGYDDIVKELSTKWCGVVLDGEIMGSDFTNTMESLFASGQRKQATYFVFDCMSLKEFNERNCIGQYNARHQNYILQCDGNKSNVVVALKGETISYSSFWQTKDELNEKYCLLGYEGLVAKGFDSLYEFKRNYGWLKYKSMITEEFQVVDFEIGKGKHSNRLGAIVVNVDGVFVNVGSGFTDEQRDYIWNNQSEFAWKFCEVKYQRKTPDKSLRSPTFVKFRNDL